jgi:hypothetical protein
MCVCVRVVLCDGAVCVAPCVCVTLGAQRCVCGQVCVGGAGQVVCEARTCRDCADGTASLRTTCCTL